MLNSLSLLKCYICYRASRWFKAVGSIYLNDDIVNLGQNVYASNISRVRFPTSLLVEMNNLTYLTPIRKFLCVKRAPWYNASHSTDSCDKSTFRYLASLSNSILATSSTRHSLVQSSTFSRRAKVLNFGMISHISTSVCNGKTSAYLA